MNTQLKNSLIQTLSVLLVLVVFTLAIMCIDISEVYVTEKGVADVGTEKVSVGLSSVNVPVAKAIGFSETWYKISKICGILAFLTAGAFAIIGMYQWITRKNIFKVDTQVLSLGVFFVIVIAIFFIFTKSSINVRPVIVDPDEWPEPSFPSSHTLLAVCVYIGSIRVLNAIFAEKKLMCKILTVIGLVIMAVAVISRLLSGVHWLTDIIASFIFSTLLICAFPFIEELVRFIQKLFLKEKQ